MKKLLPLLFLFACGQTIPEYQAPVITAPANGATFSEFVSIEWSPNNKADWTTRDYSFLVELATDAAFTSVKYGYLTKLETRHEPPIWVLKTGGYFVRVTATYVQNPTGEKTVLASVVRSFTYDGNDGAVYVNLSAVGPDYLGTKLKPVKTIGHAFEVIDRRRLSSIVLANGSYTETFKREYGLTVKGCYSPATWVRNVPGCTTTISDAAAVTFYDPLN